MCWKLINNRLALATATKGYLHSFLGMSVKVISPKTGIITKTGFENFPEHTYHRLLDVIGLW